jgi:hypothetical protein
VLILLVLWLLLFLATQLIRFVIAPASLMFFYHVLFRAWNFIFVETPHEWIYIRYHSKDKPNFSALYLRLCDKVKNNRMILSHTKYKGMIMRSRKFARNVNVNMRGGYCALGIGIRAASRIYRAGYGNVRNYFGKRK